MLAAVCCQGADTLVLVDLDTLERRGAIPVGGHPVHATIARDRVFVATMDERAVSVVDLGGDVTTVPTGVLGPSHFARAGDRVFASCTGGDAVAAIDPAELALVGRVPTGGEPHGLAVLDGLVYAGSRRDGTVTAFDPADLSAEATVEAGARIQDLEAAGDAVFAVDAGTERVCKIRREGVVATAPVGADPYDLTATDDRVYVPGRGDGTVSVFDHDLEPIAVRETGPGAAVVQPLAGEAWVAHRGAPVLRSLSGGEIDLPHSTYALLPVGGPRLLAAHHEDAAISAVDVAAGAVEATVAVDDHPLGMLVV